MSNANKMLSVVMVLVSAAIIFSGCSKKDKDKKTATPAPAVVEKTVEKTAAEPNQKIDIKVSPAVEEAVKPPVQQEVSKPAAETLKKTAAPDSAKTKSEQPASKDGYDNLKTSSEKIDYLNSFEDIYSKDGLNLLNKAVNDSDPQVRLAAIELLNGCIDKQCESQELIPVFEKALSDANSEVASAALRAVEDYNFPTRKSSLIIPLINHANPEIQEQALMASQDLPKNEAIEALTAALYSNNKDLQESAINLFASQESPQSADVLLQYLAKAPNAETQDQVLSTLTMYFGEPFENYQQAKSWWDKNRSRYDEDLNEITPEP